jgi:hypothetical protein
VQGNDRSKAAADQQVSGVEHAYFLQQESEMPVKGA